MSNRFHIPARPFTPIDAHNRAAAAKGSPRYAELATHASYNGHHVDLRWNSYRGYYVAEYFWAGRVVLARGDFATCLAAVLAEWKRGDLGTSARVSPREGDEEALALARSTPELIESESAFAHEQPWWTWRHELGNESARDMANPHISVPIFDWPLCEAAADRDAYERALKAKYGRVYA